MAEIYLQSITEEDLREMITDAVRSAMEHKPQRRPYSRQEVSDMLHVTLATLNNWNHSGKLVPAKVGNRVLYDADEVDALIKTGGIRYGL